MRSETQARRIATFSAAEVHELRASGWVRDDTRSTESVAAVANRFLADNAAEVVFVSAPNITAVHISDDKRIRTYLVQLAVIYQPPETLFDSDILAGDLTKTNAGCLHCSFRVFPECIAEGSPFF